MPRPDSDISPVDLRFAANLTPHLRLAGIGSLAQVESSLGAGDRGPDLRVIASLIDGRRTILEISRLVEAELRLSLDSALVRRLLRQFASLEKQGLIRLEPACTISADDVAAACRRVGVRPGDLLWIHSSMRALGHVSGGAEAVIDGLRRAVGDDGTLVMPTFTYSVIWNGLREFPRPQPYDPASSPSQTGAISERFRRLPGSRRTAHPTHSMAARGPLADEIADAHLRGQSPFDQRGPWSVLMRHQPKQLFLGASLATMTCLHVLEDWHGLPYMTTATALDVHGEVTIPRSPEGHRDLYLPSPRILQALAAAGVEQRRARLGLGDLIAYDLDQLFAAGGSILSNDPGILLCGDPACEFCAGAHRLLRPSPGPPVPHKHLRNP